MKKINLPALILILTFGLIGTTDRAEAQTWISASHGRVPTNAFVGGNEPGRSLVICRASHGNSGVHPGKVVGRNCNFGYGGKEILRPNYEVLIDEGIFVWVGGPQLPSNAVLGGQEPGRDLYVCRAKYRNGNHPGKVVAGRCNIGWGGREIAVSPFQVLTKREQPAEDSPWRRIVTYDDVQSLYMRARQTEDCRSIRSLIGRLDRFSQEPGKVPSDKAYSVRYGNPSDPPTIGDLAVDRMLRIKSIKRACF